MIKANVLYDSFNAKNIPSSEISKSFISNDEFFAIAKNNHTLVMGPRGCGKTTMFKMLTKPALNNWTTKNDQEKNLKSNLPFIAIYIPADEIWQEQFDEIEESLGSFPSQWVRIKESIFTTNVFVSLTKTIRDYINEITNCDEEKEFLISKTLIRAFDLDKNTIPTLLNIQKELEFRFSDIFIKSKKIIDENDTNFQDFYRLDYLKSIIPVFTEFEGIFNLDRNQSWALCFDECELIPKDLFIKLLKQIRAVPEKLLFKLSTAPTLSFDLFNSKGEYPQAKKDHDFDNVSMWPDNQDRNARYRIFCGELAHKKISDHLLNKYNVKVDFNLGDIFGEFNFNIPLDNYKSLLPKSRGIFFRDLIIQDAKQYEEFSLEWIALREYAFLDKEFAEFIESKRISSVNPKSTIKQRDEVLRKIMEIVFQRLIFVKYKIDEKGKVIKSFIGGNTNPTFYFGTKTLLNIVDGNPRYLIGLIDDFLPQIRFDKHHKNLSKISPEVQNKVYYAASNRLMNKFKSVPIVSKQLELQRVQQNNKDHLSKVIEDIGYYFRYRINLDILKTDPPTCFVIDQVSIKNDHLLTQVRTGVYLGAFIAIPKQSGELDSYDSNLSGERYRLAYLLSPMFSLPMRQYKNISLDSCRHKYNKVGNISSQLEIGHK